MNDPELLRRYVAEKSEPAFTALVQRHLGLVYSVALRRVGGDAHLAEDVAQKVFSDLARKAPSLADRATLSGWLYVATHAASAATVRREQRRKTRETEAHLMETTLAPSDSSADWSRLRPVIDDAVVTLRDQDREAIALRYFEGRSFAEVGEALRVSEDAARKRVDRAIDQLRSLLARRGITSTSAALGLALTAGGTFAVPAVLPGKIAGAALADAASQAAAPSLLTLATSLAPLAAVLTLAGLLLHGQAVRHDALRAEIARMSDTSGELATLRKERASLARALADTETARQLQQELPALRAALATPPPVAPAPVSAAISVTANGAIRWNNDAVSLREFLARLVALEAQSPGTARVVISAAQGAGHDAVRYLVDETRKARIKNFVLLLQPETQADGWWF